MALRHLAMGNETMATKKTVLLPCRIINNGRASPAKYL